MYRQQKNAEILLLPATKITIGVDVNKKSPPHCEEDFLFR
jgi:hypothetical protein